MSINNPAAEAIIRALSMPGLAAAQRTALTLALQSVFGPAATATGGSNSRPSAAATKAGRARKPAAPATLEHRIAFGKEAIAALALPVRGERLVYDTVCPQLAVRLRPGGKSYQLVMWDKARRRAVRVTLGKTEMLTPEQARRKAQALVADVGNGVDVRRPAIAGLTVADLIDRWHAEKARNVRTADELRTKALHYAGNLAHRPAAEVTRQDIGTIHSAIATTARKRVIRRVGDALQWVETGPAGLPATADKWRAMMHSVFAFAQAKGLVADNPAAGIGAAFDARGAQRSNYLHGDALLRFWRALVADSDADTRDALLLLLYTAQRKGNVLAMRWSAVDLEQGRWTLDAADTKQRKAQTVPLTAQASAILARRYRSAAGDWVFPATRGAGAMSEARMRDAWARICSAAGIEGLRVHDLRHTAGSWLARLGADVAIRQKALGHGTPAMAARYAHLELDPVANAMQGMSNAIEAAATKPAATVRKITARRARAK